MTARARQLAERCFAVARSTTHAGERANAIGRGEAICTRYGLDLDSFDVPGRRRTERSCRFSETSFRAHRPAPGFPDVLASLERALAEARGRAGADEDETPHDARARNFAAECAAARERDRARDAQA